MIFNDTHSLQPAEFNPNSPKGSSELFFSICITLVCTIIFQIVEEIHTDLADDFQCNITDFR